MAWSATFLLPGRINVVCGVMECGRVSHAKTGAILADYSLQTEPRRLRREVSTAAGATVRGGSQPRAPGRALPAQGGLV